MERLWRKWTSEKDLIHSGSLHGPCVPDTVRPSPEHGGVGGEREPASHGENRSLAGRLSWPGPIPGE